MRTRKSPLNSIASMKTFSIKELENLCDIKAHTIRVWEKRYGVFQPQRNSANARRYTTDDLSKLFSFVLLTRNGFKISSLAQLPTHYIEQSVRGLVEAEARKGRAVHELILAMYKLDVGGFESTLDTSFLSWPADEVINEIIYPFLNKVGLLCQGNRLNEEHFVVTAIRKKLYWSIQRTVGDKKQDKTVLLFLSGEKQLDLLLLYVYYQLEVAGYAVIHLGVDVSVKNLDDFMRVQKVDYLLTYFLRKPAFSLSDLSEKMNLLAPQAKLLVLKGQKCFSAEATANVFAVDSHAVVDFISTGEGSKAVIRERLQLSPAF